MLSSYPKSKIEDSFTLVLKKSQPKKALKTADLLTSASPKRLKRIVDTLPTPKAYTHFTEEDSLAVVLKLGKKKGGVPYHLVCNYLKQS